MFHPPHVPFPSASFTATRGIGSFQLEKKTVLKALLFMTIVYTIGVLAICAAAAAGHATPSPGPTSVTQAKRAAHAAQATQATQAQPAPPATQCGAWEKGESLTGHDFAHSKTGSAAACCVRSTSPVHCYCCLCPPSLPRCQTLAQTICLSPTVAPI